jgi:hypothetical protein
MRKELDAMLSCQEVFLSHVFLCSLAVTKNILAVATNIGNSLTQETMDMAGFMMAQSVFLWILKLFHVEG